MPPNPARDAPSLFFPAGFPLVHATSANLCAAAPGRTPSPVRTAWAAPTVWHSVPPMRRVRTPPARPPRLKQHAAAPSRRESWTRATCSSMQLRKTPRWKSPPLRPPPTAHAQRVWRMCAPSVARRRRCCCCVRVHCCCFSTSICPCVRCPVHCITPRPDVLAAPRTPPPPRRYHPQHRHQPFPHMAHGCAASNRRATARNGAATAPRTRPVSGCTGCYTGSPKTEKLSARPNHTADGATNPPAPLATHSPRMRTPYRPELWPPRAVRLLGSLLP